MKNFRVSTYLGAFILMCFVMVSCSKGSKNTTPGLTSHTVKYTITIAGSVSAADAGLITIVLGATDAANPSNNTIWKINGVEQKNEPLLQLTGTDFPQGKTTSIVIESTVPVTNADADLNLGNVTGFPVYVISFKAEVDGKVKNDDENISITGTNSYIHDYKY